MNTHVILLQRTFQSNAQGMVVNAAGAQNQDRPISEYVWALELDVQSQHELYTKSDMGKELCQKLYEIRKDVFGIQLILQLRLEEKGSDYWFD